MSVNNALWNASGFLPFPIVIGRKDGICLLPGKTVDEQNGVGSVEEVIILNYGVAIAEIKVNAIVRLAGEFIVLN